MPGSARPCWSGRPPSACARVGPRSSPAGRRGLPPRVWRLEGPRSPPLACATAAAQHTAAPPRAGTGGRSARRSLAPLPGRPGSGQQVSMGRAGPRESLLSRGGRLQPGGSEEYTGGRCCVSAAAGCGVPTRGGRPRAGWGLARAGPGDGARARRFAPRPVAAARSVSCWKRRALTEVARERLRVRRRSRDAAQSSQVAAFVCLLAAPPAPALRPAPVGSAKTSVRVVCTCASAPAPSPSLVPRAAFRQTDGRTVA